MDRKKGTQGLWLTPAELQGLPFQKGQFLNQETPNTLVLFARYSLPSSKASINRYGGTMAKSFNGQLKHTSSKMQRTDEGTTYSATLLPIDFSSKLYLIFILVIRGVCVCVCARACAHTNPYRAPNQLLTSLGKLIISYFPDKFSV